MSSLDDFVDKIVSVITSDGRHLVGVLKGFDQTTNVILDQCQERVYSVDAPVETVALGLYIIRGDNIAVIGLIDEEKDMAIDLSGVRVEPLKHISH